MPLFAAYSGDVVHLALAEEGSFFVTDDRGVAWVCRLLAADRSNVGSFAHLGSEVFASLAASCGADPDNTSVGFVILFAADVEALRRELSREPAIGRK